MTQLRDARLREALEQAPDASMRPPARTREAIHAAAHAALQPAWRRWWASSGQRTGWSAAFATVLLAGFVTLLWRGEDVPQAEPPPPPSASRVPAPAPARLPEVAAPATAPARSAPPPSRSEKAAAMQDAQQQRQRQQRAREAPPPPPERSLQERQAAAPAAAMAPRAAALAGADWTQVRIEAGSDSKVVPRRSAERLPALLARALAAETESLRVTGPADLTIEIGQGDQALGVLARHGEQWRWQPLGDARQGRTLRIDPALSAALQQEAEQLLRR